MELNPYLCERYTPRSAYGYSRLIEQYRRHVTSPEQAKYKDVLNYLEARRKEGKKSGTILGHLAAIKAYYDWLNQTGKRADHPCKHLRLKDRGDPRINVQDLFSSTELSLLLEQPPRPISKLPSLVLRDKVILSLLIYQGLTTQNIVKLEVKDLDLEHATLYVKRGTTLNARTLELHPKQIMLLNRYLREEWPLLNKRKLNNLILTRRYQAERGCGVDDVVKVYRSLYPGKVLTPLTIRQSVIANLLKSGSDIRAVQVFAGHRNPRTTERYEQTGIQELTDAVLKFHPLG